MNLEEAKRLIESILPSNVRGGKPHKSLAILTIIEGLTLGNYRENKFPYDKTFRTIFSQLFKLYAKPDERDRPLNPFFHLRSNRFWHLIPQEGKENVLGKVSSIGAPHELHELVRHASIAPELFTFLLEPVNRKNLGDYIRAHLTAYLNSGETIEPETHRDLNSYSPGSRLAERQSNNATAALFPDEDKALKEIHKALGTEVKLLANYELYDPQTNQYLECDLIAVDVTGAAIIELKHWAGTIEIAPNKWVINDQTYRDDPHKTNNFKCKVLSSFLQKAFPNLPKIWVESIVVLTNPDATVLNANRPDTRSQNPTFSRIADFVKYFKMRPDRLEHRLTLSQANHVLEKIKSFGEPKKGDRVHVSGWHTLENITKSAHVIEILATPLNLNVQTPKRLRIFLPDPSASESSRQSQRIQSQNGLKAIEAIGDHPNILKVWNVHDEEGRVVECSDWSEEGTLDTLLKKKQKLPLKDALEIFGGILRGLEAIHVQAVIHRDICPANILILRGLPKLMNFDLSYIPEDERLTVMPEKGLAGKSPYVPPELLFPGGQFSEASDLFSVGVMLFQTLTGDFPFRLSSDLPQSEGQLNAASVKLLEEEKIPLDLIELIRSLIQYDRKKRPQEAADVISKLLPYLTPAEEKQPRESPEINKELSPGDSYNVYEIIRRIGEGRDSRVYEAVQPVNREVAIKLFNIEVDRERIYQERDLLQRVKSPYVVKCETLNQWEDQRYFLVLELVRGSSLRLMIEDLNRPPLEKFFLVASRILDALVTMHLDSEHEQPLLHNDIKPDNILLTETCDPVIIDFGSASFPRIGPYTGTVGYVAPDLLDGAHIAFSPSGDLFALGITLFEWFCGERPYDDIPNLVSPAKSARVFRDDCPQELDAWFLKAVSTLAINRFADALEMKNALSNVFEPTTTIPEEAIPRIPVVEPIMAPGVGIGSHPFVSYLNTLHNLTAGNENALAESQALSAQFGFIHIPMPVTDRIEEELKSPDGAHVILTGHAGDGKSTIALDLFKRLKGIPMEKPLSVPLKEREKVQPDSDRVINIVKDMSELAASARQDLLRKASQANNADERWLIISNTGTLLGSFDVLAREYGITRSEVESKLLKILEHPDPQIFDAFGARFLIINLARMDNVKKAVNLLQKIIAMDRWSACKQCPFHQNCPIWLNVQALNPSGSFAVQRVGLIYRLLYDYGKRLTMRQISAHLAYSITGGLECDEIHGLALSQASVNLDLYLFHNLFFGYSGSKPNPTMSELSAVEMLLPLEMGSRPLPRLERLLYVNNDLDLSRIPPALTEFIKRTIEVASADVSTENRSLSRIRQQIRRFIYLYYDVQSYNLKDFPPTFLGSQAILDYHRWEKNPQDFGNLEKQRLLEAILRVLQEQFTGHSISHHQSVGQLFITAKRSSSDLRQSVQILYAKVPKDNFRLEYRVPNSSASKKRPVLVLMESYSKAELILDVPLLDFVMLRAIGEIGKDIDPAYVDRINRFKTLLMIAHRLDDLELLRFSAPNLLNTVQLSISGTTLTVIE